MPGLYFIMMQQQPIAYNVTILSMPQLGYAVSELGKRIGLSLFPSTDIAIVAEQLNQIASSIGLGFNISRPYPLGLINAVYYWLKAAYECQSTNVI